MEILSEEGRTSIVYRTQQGLVCKLPKPGGSERKRTEIANNFTVEKLLLLRLGDHPRIIQYCGLSTIQGEEGLLLGEANCGDLQSYIDKNDGKIDDVLRRKWCLEIAEAVAYVHEKGIIHSNLSTTNVLVHQTGQSKHLLLADFGGSKCPDLGLNGHLLPDDPFFDPHLTDFESPKVDVFSLGIVLYIISTSHYPFYRGPAPRDEERYPYQERVNKQFSRNEFPDLSGVLFANVIAGCCCERRFKTANDVVMALKPGTRWYKSRRSQFGVAFFIMMMCGIFKSMVGSVGRL